MSQRQYEEESEEMSVIVIVRGAKDLPSRDTFSQSDPYVIVEFKNFHEKFQTDYMIDKPNPVWEHDNTFYITALRSQMKNYLSDIYFTVNDYDLGRKDDYIGRGLVSGVYQYKNYYTLENSQIQEVQLYHKKEEAGKVIVQVFVVNGPVKEKTQFYIKLQRLKPIFGNKISEEKIKEALSKPLSLNKKVKHEKIKMVKHYTQKLLGVYDIKFVDLVLPKHISTCKGNIVKFITNAFCFLLTLAGLPGAWKRAKKIGDRLLRALSDKAFKMVKKAIQAYKEVKKTEIMKKAKKLWDTYKKINEFIGYGEIIKDIMENWNKKNLINHLIIASLTIASWFAKGPAGFCVQCLLALPDAVELTKFAVITIDSCSCKDENNNNISINYTSNNGNYNMSVSSNNYSISYTRNNYNSNYNNNNNNKNIYIKKLTINVIKGINLKDLDTGYGDKSDPYVKITCFGSQKEIFKTRKIDNDLNPYWNEKFTVRDNNNFDDLSRIQFDVYDHDRYSNDDLIGSYTVKYPSQQNHFQNGRSRTQRVELKYKNKKNRGQLEFKLTFE